MLPAVSTYLADEASMFRTCVVPPLHINLDQILHIDEQISPQSATKSPTKDPLALDPSPSINEVTTLNVVLEIQRKRPHSPVNCDDDNNKRCCVRLEYRRDSESGFSSATEDTNDTAIVDKHSSIDTIDNSSPPESAVAYIFSTTPKKSIVPSVTSPFNYPRDYSFCSGKRSNHKPLDLTIEFVKDTCSKSANKKVCLNSINKNIYNEPEQYINKTKIKNKENTSANKENDSGFSSEILQNLPLNLHRQVDFPPDSILDVNTDTDGDYPINIQHAPIEATSVASCGVVDTENESIPSHLQNYEESTTHGDKIIDSYKRTTNLIPQSHVKNLFQIVPRGDFLSGTIQREVVNLVSINDVPDITQNEVQNTNSVPKDTEIENKKYDHIHISNDHTSCQTDKVQQTIVINVSRESPVHDGDNICEPDLATKCLQEFFQTWNENCSPDMIADYTDAPLASVYTNNDVDSLQMIASEPVLEQSMTCIISNIPTVNQGNDISQQEMSQDKAKELLVSTETLPDKNNSIIETVGSLQEEKEVCSVTLKNKYHPLSMPLLGGEPELSLIPEQPPQKEKHQEKEETQSQESIPPSLVLDGTEAQIAEITLSQYSTTETEAQTPPHTSEQSEVYSPEVDNMLQKIMKPTLPQNSTLVYSRFFNNDHLTLESFLARPSMSPKSSIPVILSSKVARSQTPTTPTRIMPKRRVSMGSVSSNSPDLSLTPITRSMRRAAAAHTMNQQDPLTSSPVITESSVDEDSTFSLSSPTSSIPSIYSPTPVPTPRGRGRPRHTTLSAVNSTTAQCNASQNLFDSQSPVTRSRKKDFCSPALSTSSKVHSLSPRLQCKILLLNAKKTGGSETPKRGQSRERCNSLSIHGAQSPSIKGAKGRGRSHSPAVRSKVKKVEEIKFAIEKNAPKLNASDLFVQREREKMLQHDSWMETRRELYSKLIPNVQMPSASCTNMQPLIVLERNPGLDARAISDAALAKLQCERVIIQ